MSSAQSAFFVEPADQETDDKPAKGKRDVITMRDLSRSLVACHRIEDELWKRLRADGCTPASSAAKVANCLRYGCAEPPSWCEKQAWERIKQSMLGWARIFGSLQLHTDLRNKKDADTHVTRLGAVSSHDG